MKPSISFLRYSGWTQSGMLRVVLLQALLVGREAEEPVVLGEPLELDIGVVGAVHARSSSSTRSLLSRKPSLGQYQPSYLPR